MEILVRHPRSFGPERAYALDAVLREGLGLAWRSLPEDRGDVELGAPGHDGAVVMPDVLFPPSEARDLHHAAAPAECAGTLTERWARDATGAEAVPVVFGAPDGGAWLTEEGTVVRLGIDVPGTAFFLLTRMEERLAGGARDVHGRFQAEASAAHRLGFLDRPLVDESVELLRAALRRALPRLETVRPPYAEEVSHDVDFVDGRRLGLARTLRAAARDAITAHAPAVAVRRAAAPLLRPLVGPRCDVFNTFGALMELSERHGLRSTFFFIAGRAPDGIDDDNYELSEPWVRSVLREIAARGHAIGLHGSYGSFDAPAQLRAELHVLQAALDDEGIDRGAIGCRQHFLRFDPAVTWPAQADAGITYDATVGFAEQPGFRSGTCREHGVFDLVRRRPLPLRERPLTLMDTTLLDPAYLALDRDGAVRTAERLKAACRRVGGTFRLLWHNTMLVTPAHRALYEDVLAC